MPNLSRQRRGQRVGVFIERLNWTFEFKIYIGETMSVHSQDTATIIYAGPIDRKGYQNITNVCENLSNPCLKAVGVSLDELERLMIFLKFLRHNLSHISFMSFSY